MKEFNIKSLWPDWDIVRLIGEGSFGKVYEIVRNNFGIEEHSAIKVIKIPSSQAELQSLRNEGMDDFSATEYYRGLVEDVVQEIALMSRLKGQANIVGYEDYAVIEHKDYIGWDIVIRMELLTDLPSYIRKNSFCVNDILKLAIDVCSALEVCHEQKIIHRDIKPDNIFVSANGDFKLGDFGVARTVEKTVSGLSKKGTYTYMAPEVYKGEAYGTDVDLYSLGIVMYKLLNNNREPFLPEYPAPIRYSDKNDALARRLSGENIPLPSCASVASVYRQLSEIVVKACSFRSCDRYQTPTQMKVALKNVSVENTTREASRPTEKILTPSPQMQGGDDTANTVGTSKTVSIFNETSAQTVPPASEVVNTAHQKKLSAKPNPAKKVVSVQTQQVTAEKTAPVHTQRVAVKKAEPVKSKQKSALQVEPSVLIFGWIGFTLALAVSFSVLPYIIVQTVGVLVSMILLSFKKSVKFASFMLLIAGALSLNIPCIIAGVIAVVNLKKAKKPVLSPADEVYPEPTMNYCKKCGAKLNDSYMFCWKCGEPK